MKPDLRVHIATVGFQVKRITEPLILERSDKVYLITHSQDDKSAPYLEKISKVLRKEKFLKVEKRTTNNQRGRTGSTYLYQCITIFSSVNRTFYKLELVVSDIV
jgi:hypothetical protein